MIPITYLMTDQLKQKVSVTEGKVNMDVNEKKGNCNGLMRSLF